jgi:DNA-binding NtrC family response regulator
VELVSILIVDDEKEFASSLSKVLARRGFQVETALSGQEALELLGRRSFQVALLDVKMPGQDGLALLKIFQERAPAMAVILMTGHISPEEELSGKAVGAFAYLLKPHPIPQLVELIQKAAKATGPSCKKGQGS